MILLASVSQWLLLYQCSEKNPINNTTSTNPIAHPIVHLCTQIVPNTHIFQQSITKHTPHAQPIRSQNSQTLIDSYLFIMHWSLMQADVFLTWGSWYGRWHRNKPRTRLGSSAPHLPVRWRRSLWCCVYRCRSGRGGRWLLPVSLNTPRHTDSH